MMVLKYSLSFLVASCTLMLLVTVTDADPFAPTPHLPKTILIRCLEYFQKYRSLGFVDPEPKKGAEEEYCNQMLTAFLDAFAFRDACEVKMKDYEKFLTKPGIKPIKDKILLWSKHQELSLQLAGGGRAAVLANTLPGYLVTDLTWCGEPKGSSKNPDKNGINYIKCPECKKKNKDQPEHFEVFWGIASQEFAKRASGVVRHLVNGAVGNKCPACAYHDKTFFAQHELPNLDKTKVTEFRIIVANEPGKTVYERCGQGSIKQLQEAVKKHFGKEPTCIENPKEVMHIYCARPEHTQSAVCELKNKYPDF